ncbi:acetyltransferase [Marinomonas algarum]|uniref:Acetyltransferase n=1 Tax=Marinomonas algarum TaxID=2883105 RepID=A0A9X1INZ8_9GAMM|nr:acetyltransferase [Marinomonas algarum]MCB5161506.1 acetyltransferase [Marinomonas algarum]
MTEPLPKALAILGASGHGKVVADLAEQLGYIVYFYDDAYPKKTSLEHWPICGKSDDLLKQDNTNLSVAVAIGNNTIRQQKIDLLNKEQFYLPILIHPRATVSQYAQLSLGSVVLAGAIVNAFARIGKGVIINSSAVIEHDCVIGDFSHICPNTSLAGGVTTGTQVWVGIGSQVKQLINIGDNVLIGAGSTLLKDLPANTTAYGSPAKIIALNS